MNATGAIRDLGNFKWLAAIRRGFKHPWMALEYLWALAKGKYYVLKFRLLGRRVTVGRRFRVMGRLDIRGPGTVMFGDDCIVFSTRIAPTTPWTQAPGAVIRFGNQVGLNGTRMSCRQSIDVGDGSMLAEARIIDSDFHAIEPQPGEHRLNSSGVSKPIVIDRNVWVCLGAIVLKGVRIGENSVVAGGAVVAGRVPPNVVVFGNPARVVWQMKRPVTNSTEASSSP